MYNNMSHLSPDVAVADAIETVEREAWLDLYAAAPPSYLAASGLIAERLGPAIAALADPSVPIVEMNRVMGLGLQGPLDAIQLDPAIAWLDDHAAPGWSIQLPGWPQPSSPLEGLLTSRDLHPAGNGWAKFCLRASSLAMQPLASSFEIRDVGEDWAEAFGATVQAGFGLPAETSSWFAALPGRPNWRTYLAFDGDRPVGAAAMFLRSGWAWMGIDTTLEDARSKGVQSALIWRRLEDGLHSGVIGFTAETANPPPVYGAGFQSFDNYRRAGFAQAYTRRNYKRKA
jgi:hypothetical protein